MPVIFLFILESIGTQELILVGLVALIVFGPRKLPQMARKFGNMLAEFRKVSNDFKQTWEREASMVEEAFRAEDPKPASLSGAPVAREKPEDDPSDTTSGPPELPAISEVSPEDFENARPRTEEDSAASLDPDPPAVEPEPAASDKRNWL